MLSSVDGKDQIFVEVSCMKHRAKDSRAILFLRRLAAWRRACICLLACCLSSSALKDWILFLERVVHRRKEADVIIVVRSNYLAMNWRMIQLVGAFALFSLMLMLIELRKLMMEDDVLINDNPITTNTAAHSIRRWGCHRTEAPFIFVHIGKVCCVHIYVFNALDNIVILKYLICILELNRLVGVKYDER